MEKSEFKKLLFKVAFCTMACDGHIDEREVEEIKMMDENSSFFRDIDLSTELSQLIKEFQNEGSKVIEALFAILRETKLNPIQELLILEVALRVINADNKHDANELKFIRLLRAKLDLHDQTIDDRFGDLDILHTSNSTKKFVTKAVDIDFSASITLPELQDMQDVLRELEHSQ